MGGQRHKKVHRSPQREAKLAERKNRPVPVPVEPSSIVSQPVETMGVVPPPDKPFAKDKWKLALVMNGFLGTVQTEGELALVAAFSWVGAVRQWYRFSMPLSEPVVQEFLRSGSHERRGNMYAMLRGFGPLSISGTWVGVDRNSKLDDGKNLPTQVLASVTLTSLR